MSRMFVVILVLCLLLTTSSSSSSSSSRSNYLFTSARATRRPNILHHGIHTFCTRKSRIGSSSTCSKRISNVFLPQTSLDKLAVVDKREKRIRHARTKNAVALALVAPTIPRGGSSNYYPGDDDDSDNAADNDRYYSSSRRSNNAYYGDQNREDDSWVYQNRGDGDSYYNNRGSDNNNPYYGDERDNYYERQEQQSSSSYDSRGRSDERNPPHGARRDSYYNEADNNEEQDYYNRDMRQRPREDYSRERTSSSRSTKSSSGKTKVSLEGIPGYSVVSKGNRRIGTMIVGGGLVVTMLGISLFFNKTLMRLGNLLLVIGIPILIGPGRTAGYFLQPTKFRATGCLMVGIFLVFVGWPIFGIALEVFGLLNLFGNMFPLLKVILKQMPFVGDLFNSKTSSTSTKRKRSRYDDDAGYGDGEEQYY